MKPRLTRALDWLLLTSVAVTLLLDISGGLLFTVGGVRIAARSPDRGFLLTLVVLAVRLALDRHSPPPLFLTRFWRRVYRPDADVIAPVARGGRWPRRALHLAGYAAFGAVLLHNQWQHMDAVADLGDPLFSLWRLNWVVHQLHGDPRPLFDANIYYPTLHTFTFSDSMLLPGLMTAPLLAAGVHPVVAYNVMLLGSFLASACACDLLIEELTGSPAAAFIGGLLFAFHPFHFEHYQHLELLMTFWIPLAVLALHRFIRTLEIRYAVIAALLTVALLYSSMYLAVYFLWFAAMLAGILCGFVKPPVRRVLAAAALAGVIALALAYPLARAYTSTHLPDRPFYEVADYSADYTDYLRAHPRSAFWADRTLGAPSNERALFPGGVVLVLAALALVPPIGMIRVAYTGALLLAFEITRGSKGFLYVLLYDYLPFMRGLRVPARASLLVGLALAVLAGFAVRRVLASISRLRSAAVVMALTVAIGIDLRPSLSELWHVWRTPPPIYQGLAGRTDVVLAEFPFALKPDAWVADTPFLYFSLWHWLPMINGYSGYAPDGFAELRDALRAFPSESTLALLEEKGVTHVTVNCALYVEHCDALLQHVEARPELRLVKAETWEGQPVRLYELRHVAAVATASELPAAGPLGYVRK